MRRAILAFDWGAHDFAKRVLRVSGFGSKDLGGIQKFFLPIDGG